MLRKFIDWFKPLPDAAEKITDPQEITKQYKRWRLRLFISAYIGYAMYYVTRQNLNPIAHVFKAETGITNDQFGLMVSISLIAYGIGKFVSGMLADKSNIRVFLAFGLMASSVIPLAVPVCKPTEALANTDIVFISRNRRDAAIR